MTDRRERDSAPMGFTSLGVPWEIRQLWFMWLFLTVVLYWVPLIYMGLRVLQIRWVVYGVLYALPGAFYLLVSGSGMMLDDAGNPMPGFVASLMYMRNSAIAFAVFALIHTWVAREEFLLRLAERVYEQDDIRKALSSRGAAAEAGAEGGEAGMQVTARRLFNVNRITEAELAMLPGLGNERAKQALQLRADLGDFRSFADFASKLQLPERERTRLRPLFEADSEEVALVIPKDDPAYRMMPDGTRVLELNWASAEALGALPGLGPELARRAVTMRDGDGPFKSIEDFRFRLGLKMDVMIKITPYVSVISMSTRPGGGSGTKTGGRIVDV